MHTSDFSRLILLAALWGASFLFMRIAAPEFGPAPLVLLRTAVSVVCLVPLLLDTNIRSAIFQHRYSMLIVGVFNCALPFTLLAYATLSVEAGFASLLNSTTPLFTAIIGAFVLNISLRRSQILGLILGFAGVAVLGWGQLSFKTGGTGWAIVAALTATLSYGIAANYTRQKLSGVSARAITAGSMIAATLVLLPIAIPLLPEQNPSLLAWSSGLGLAVLCTAFAFVLYFNLIAKAGATAATTVTFIVPVFAILFGVWLLDEALTPRITAGMIVILLGTGLTTGLIGTQKVKQAA